MPRKKTEDLIDEKLLPIQAALESLTKLLSQKTKEKETTKKKKVKQPDPDQDEDEEENNEDLEKDTKKVLFKNFKNKYKDKVTEIEKQTNILPANGFSLTQRPKYKKVRVKCKNCGRTKEVDPIEAPRRGADGEKMGYSCDNCSSRK